MAPPKPLGMASFTFSQATHGLQTFHLYYSEKCNLQNIYRKLDSANKDNRGLRCLPRNIPEA